MRAIARPTGARKVTGFPHLVVRPSATGNPADEGLLKERNNPRIAPLNYYSFGVKQERLFS
jgi:hypothetical protein